MESIQNLKKRLKSVNNIGKITKAMELVAATKMRRAQEIALASRPYAFVALDLLVNLSLSKTDLPELFKKRPHYAKASRGEKTLFVLVASDKGLAGSFNSSLFRKFERYFVQYNNSPSFAKASEGDSDKNIFVAVGEKTFAYLSRKKFNVIKKFTNVGDFTTSEQVQPLADFLIEGYLNKEWDRVIIFSNHFKSALKQEPMMREILPISFESIKETVKEIVPTTGKFSNIIQPIDPIPSTLNPNYLIEPSPEVVLEKLAKHLFFMQVYHLILEANASEHSARRMAMKTASDNASDLSEKLNLQYNKSRQAGITNQIIEISAGAEALS